MTNIKIDFDWERFKRIFGRFRPRYETMFLATALRCMGCNEIVFTTKPGHPRPHNRCGCGERPG